jgi:NADPH:quinone reductase-like Zn-dependent oxidoreductase
MGRQLRALARSPFTRQRLTMLISRQRHADLETLARVIEAGQLTPVIGKTHPLHQTPTPCATSKPGTPGGSSFSR